VTTKIPAASLDALLAFLRGPGGRALTDREWTRLPTFGGEAPRSTSGVWSWDESRILVGTGPDDLAIRARPRPRSGPRYAGQVLLALTVEEKARARSAADRAHTPLAIWIRSLVLRECDRIDSLDALRCEECGHLTGGGYRGHKRDCSKALVPKPPAPSAA
jgi:hypothetical protein